MRSTLIGAVVVLLVWFLPLWRPALGRRVSLAVEDGLARAAGAGVASGQVVVVGIDEESLGRLGRWPWPRERVAELVEACARAGARMVVLDMLLPEGSGERGAVSAGDAALAAAMKRVRTVVGYQLTVSGPGAAGAGAAGVLSGGAPGGLSGSAAGGPGAAGGASGVDGGGGGLPLCEPGAVRLGRVEESAAGVMRLAEADGAVCSLPLFTQAAAGSGFLNGLADGDGLMRRAPVVMQARGELYAGLPLAAWLALSGGPAKWEEANAEGAWLVRQGSRVWLSEGMMRVRYRGAAGALARVSAARLMSGEDAEAVRGRIAVVGGLAAGLQNHVTTPVESVMPGVEFQATVLDNLVRGDALRPPVAATLSRALLVLAVVAGVTLLMGQASGWAAAGGVLAILLVLWGGCWEAARGAGVILSPLSPTVAVCLALGGLIPLRLRRVRQQMAGAARLKIGAQRFALTAMQMASDRRRLEGSGRWERFPKYLAALCEAAAGDARYQAAMTDEAREMIVELAPLGELGEALAEAGTTEEEFRELLTRAWQRGGGGDERMIRTAMELCCCHQERWDGAGRPKGLHGEEIPLAGRMAAIAEVYDALVRSQGPAAGLGHAAAVQVIEAGRGTRFDPVLVDCFLTVQERFRAISEAGAEGRTKRRGVGL